MAATNNLASRLILVATARRPSQHFVLQPSISKLSPTLKNSPSSRLASCSVTLSFSILSFLYQRTFWAFLICHDVHRSELSQILLPTHPALVPIPVLLPDSIGSRPAQLLIRLIQIDVCEHARDKKINDACLVTFCNAAFGLHTHNQSSHVTCSQYAQQIA